MNQTSEVDDARVTRAVEEYLAAIEAGRKPNREGFLARYWEIAPALAECLDGLEFIQVAGPRLQESAADQVVATTAADIRPEGPLGDFRIVREVGRGGMGVVYEAVQISLGRRVALKVLPFASALDAKQLQRFKNEAQAAAHLHHQNIVPVHAVGCERGVHYYAMQFIEGQTLATVIADLRLQNADMQPPVQPAIQDHQPASSDPQSQIGNLQSALATQPVAGLSTERSIKNPAFFRTVAQLGVQAAEALEHAHNQGVVHRDIKPANLLLDGHGNLWVTDFGLALLQNEAGITMTGDLVGTARYMSPEQARGKRGLVDQGTDIYSLGATLYELLTLEPAFAGGDRQEVLARISLEEPRPPRRLNSAVPAELETIVLKAMEKNPAERYAAAQELAHDLRRYLEDRPIQAKRPTLWQKAKKWARRNRQLVWSLAVSSLAVLILAVIGLVISNSSITQEKKDKERALAEAEANLVLARQAVDEMYTQVAGELANLPSMQPVQRQLLQKALRFYQEFARRKSGDPMIRLETAHASLRVAEAQSLLGQRRQVELCRDTITELERLTGELPAEPQVQLVLGEAYTLLGGILAESGRRQQAEQSHRQAAALYEQLAAGRSNVSESQRRLAASYDALGGLLRHRPREAEKCHQHAIALWENIVAGWPGVPLYHLELARSHYLLGYLLAGTGQQRRAEQAFRQAIDLLEKAPGALDPSSYCLLRASVEYELGNVLAASGQADKAERAYRQAVALAERIVLLFPGILGDRINLASYYLGLDRLLVQNGKTDEAEVFKRSARAAMEKLAAEFPEGIGNPMQSIHWLASLARMQRDLGKLREAEQTLRKVLTLAGKLAAEHATEPSARQIVAASHGNLGVILQRAGLLREAADEFRQDLAICEELAAEFPGEPEYRYLRANVGNFLGIALRAQPGEAEAAVQHHCRVIALCDQLVAEFPDEPSYRGELVRSQQARGIALDTAGRCPEAEQAFELALAAYRPEIDNSRDDFYRGLFASVHNSLAWLWATRPDEQFRNVRGAVESAGKAVELEPTQATFCNTLGVAHYRAGHWKEALAAFKKSMDLRRGGDSFDWFFLAMAHEQLGDNEEAQKWYQRAVEWMDKHEPENDELRRFRAEADELLKKDPGIGNQQSDKKQRSKGSDS